MHNLSLSETEKKGKSSAMHNLFFEFFFSALLFSFVKKKSFSVCNIGPKLNAIDFFSSNSVILFKVCCNTSETLNKREIIGINK